MPGYCFWNSAIVVGISFVEIEGSAPYGDGTLDMRRKFLGVYHDGVDFMEYPLKRGGEFPANGGQHDHTGAAVEQADFHRFL